MYSIELHKEVIRVMEFFHRIAFWERGDKATAKEMQIKIFYLIYYMLFPISLIVGAYKSDSSDESILLAESAIMGTVILIKMFYLTWKKKEIVELLHQIGVYSIKDHEDYTFANDNLKTFLKWIKKFYISSISMGFCIVLVVPFIGNERKLFFNIGFPFDYKNNTIAYWIAFVFIFTEIMLTAIVVLFSILMWYFMLNCVLKYEVLGRQLKTMGSIKAVECKISKMEEQQMFHRDLIAGIKSHKDINESTDTMETFLSNILSAQLATSALCICASVYCLAYSNSETVVEFIIYLFYLFFNIFDIFMVMYFGNEIKLSTERLSYSVFESNWVDQTDLSKKCIIIFAERLKQPQEMVILKLYPLTLETFTRILNSAYSMFNILKTLST